MSNFGHDMDHDGKITGKDMALFHEMMEEDARKNNGSGSSCGPPGPSLDDAVKHCIPLLVGILLIVVFLLLD